MTSPDGLTEWDRTRLAVSWSAMQVADLACELADTRGDGVAQPGSFARDAARIRTFVESLQEYAVVLERMRGTTWTVIADSVGGRARQSAHERWARAEGDWRAFLASYPNQMPVGMKNPDDLVRDLERRASRRGIAGGDQIMAGLDGVRVRWAETIEGPLREALGTLLDCVGQAVVGFAGLRTARRILENSEAPPVDVLDAALAALASLACDLRDGSVPPAVAKAAHHLSAVLGVHPDQARTFGPHHRTQAT